MDVVVNLQGCEAWLYLPTYRHFGQEVKYNRG